MKLVKCDCGVYHTEDEIVTHKNGTTLCESCGAYCNNCKEFVGEGDLLYNNKCIWCDSNY